MYGMQKYSLHNWTKGLHYSRVFNPLMRHLEKWRAGEDFDEEDNLLHLAHVCWNALVLLHYQLRDCDPQLDDVRWPRRLVHPMVPSQPVRRTSRATNSNARRNGRRPNQNHKEVTNVYHP